MRLFSQFVFFIRTLSARGRLLKYEKLRDKEVDREDSCIKIYLQRQPWTKYFAKKYIKESQTRSEHFDICVWVIFVCERQKFIFAGETGH